MGALKIVQREINLRAIDANVRIVCESQADAVVESKDELAVRHMVLKTLRPGQLRRGLLAAVESQRRLQRRDGLRTRIVDTHEGKKHRSKKRTQPSHRAP